MKHKIQAINICWGSATWNGPFDDNEYFNHLNTRLVYYSDPTVSAIFRTKTDNILQRPTWSFCWIYCENTDIKRTWKVGIYNQNQM